MIGKEEEVPRPNATQKAITALTKASKNMVPVKGAREVMVTMVETRGLFIELGQAKRILLTLDLELQSELITKAKKLRPKKRKRMGPAGTSLRG